MQNGFWLFAFGPPPCGSNGNAKDPEER